MTNIMQTYGFWIDKMSGIRKKAEEQFDESRDDERGYSAGLDSIISSFEYEWDDAYDYLPEGDIYDFKAETLRNMRDIFPKAREYSLAEARKFGETDPAYLESFSRAIDNLTELVSGITAVG